MEFTCPPGYSAHNNTCYSLGFEALNKVFRFSLLLEFSNNLLIPYVLNDPKNFSESLLEYLDPNHDCKEFDTSILFKIVESLSYTYVLVAVRVPHKGSCNESAVANLYSGTKIFNFFVDGNTFAMFVALYTPDRLSRPTVFQKISDFEFPLLPGAQSEPAPVKYCPYIFLELFEICDLFGLNQNSSCSPNYNSDAFQSFTIVKTGIDNDLYCICIDDYMEMFFEGKDYSHEIDDTNNHQGFQVTTAVYSAISFAITHHLSYTLFALTLSCKKLML